MSNASQNTDAGAHNGHWTATANKSGTYEFYTGGKYVDRDIDLIIPEAEISTSSTDASASVTSVTVSGTKNANSKYPVTGSGTISGNITATVGTKGFTDESSYTGGKVSGTASVKAELSPAVLAASVDNISGASITTVTVGTKSGTNYPLTGSTTVTGKLHANVSTAGYATSAENKEGNLSQSVSLSNVTIPAAAATVTGSATVKPNSLTAANGNAKIASAATTTQPTSGYYVAATPATATTTNISQSKTGLTAGYLGTLNEISADGTVSGGNGSKYYIPIQSAGVTKGTTTVNASTKAVTRGTFDVSEGYISGTAGDLAAATFANSATSGKTYVDISETTAAPILVSGDYLYINQGYTDNLKISLAKLVPELPEDYDMGASADMLAGKTLYDNDGMPVTGSIQDLTSSLVTVSGKTVTIPAGYYTTGTEITKSVASGSVNSYSIDETTQASKVLTAGAKSGDYYPISVPSLTGTVNRTAGYISGTTSTATDSNGGVVGKIAAATVTGTASDTKSTTLTYDGYKSTSNLASDTYRTSAATNYTYHIDTGASVTAATASASRTVSAGYSNAANTASATASISAASKSGSVYLLDGKVTNGYTGTETATQIDSGNKIKIAKGYYPTDSYYIAQKFTQEAITNNLTSSIDGDYTAPTLIDSGSKISGKSYVSFSAQGTMNKGNQYNGTSTPKVQCMEVYGGLYNVVES